MNTSGQKYPHVAFIILNWNSKEFTTACLQSIKGITYPNYHIFCVDCGSTDGSAEHLEREFPWITLIKSKINPGAAGGRNIGITHALNSDCSYILFLDNDTEVHESFLEELIAVGEARKDVGFLSPKIYYYGQKDKLWYAGGRISLLRGVPDHFGMNKSDSGRYNVPKEVKYMPSTALLNKREVVEKVGFMDEKFFVYGEDADWCIRALKQGYKGYYVPASRIWHKEGVTRKNRGNPYRKFLGSRNIMYFAYKHNSRPLFILFILYFICVRMPLHTFKSLIRLNFAEVAGLWRGFFAFWSFNKTKD